MARAGPTSAPLVIAASKERGQADATIARLTLEAAAAWAEVDQLTGAEA